jgi:hypothetical protein
MAARRRAAVRVTQRLDVIGGTAAEVAETFDRRIGLQAEPIWNYDHRRADGRIRAAPARTRSVV